MSGHGPKRRRLTLLALALLVVVFSRVCCLVWSGKYAPPSKLAMVLKVEAEEVELGVDAVGLAVLGFFPPVEDVVEAAFGDAIVKARVSVGVRFGPVPGVFESKPQTPTVVLLVTIYTKRSAAGARPRLLFADSFLELAGRYLHFRGGNESTEQTNSLPVCSHGWFSDRDVLAHAFSRDDCAGLVCRRWD
jgi:hypothetical protein